MAGFGWVGLGGGIGAPKIRLVLTEGAARRPFVRIMFDRATIMKAELYEVSTPAGASSPQKNGPAKIPTSVVPMDPPAVALFFI